jgi:hypothetical protein
MAESGKVLGIATEYDWSNGSSFDFLWLDIPEWTEENEQLAREISKKYHVFDNPKMTKYRSQEYPIDDENT